MLYPLLFKPVYRDYLWGGERIAENFGRAGTPVPCAESWEVSAHPDGMSVIENGELEGRTLDDVCREFGDALLGANCEGRVFPLLIKLIDAKERLSVQVHPNDESAERYGGEAKTEMWYILDAPAGAFVCAGLKDRVGSRAFHDAIVDKNVASLLRKVDVVPGKSIFIPGGLVHAIGEGCLILEVQQNSNTTYRVYDWDRVGADGKARDLHVRQAMEVIDWKAPNLGLLAAMPMSAVAKANKRERVLRCDYFTMERYTLAEPEPVEADGRSFRAVFAAQGSVKIVSDLSETLVEHGRSCLIPAEMRAYQIVPIEDSATILTVEVR